MTIMEEANEFISRVKNGGKLPIITSYSPVEQFMAFIYSLQDVKISLERINEIHSGRDEEDECGDICRLPPAAGITLSGVGFKYDLHARTHTLHEDRKSVV